MPRRTTYREQQPGGSDGQLEMGIPHPAVVIGVSATFTDRVNNTGFFSGHTSGFGFLFLRPSAVGDPHPVHDHRLRRVGTSVRGDEQGRQLRGSGPVTLHLLLGHRRDQQHGACPVRGQRLERRSCPPAQEDRDGECHVQANDPDRHHGEYATGTGAPPTSTFTRAGSVSTTATMAERTTAYTGTLWR